jgi:hypothetical protein
VLAKQRDRDIVVTVLHDGLPVGGMTFRITPITPKQGLKRGKKRKARK